MAEKEVLDASETDMSESIDELRTITAAILKKYSAARSVILQGLGGIRLTAVILHRVFEEIRDTRHKIKIRKQEFRKVKFSVLS